MYIDINNVNYKYTRTVGNERYNRFERERNERTLTMSVYKKLIYLRT